MSLRGFPEELHHRNVFKAAVACPAASYFRAIGAIPLYKTQSNADGAALCDIRFMSLSVDAS